MLSDSSVSFCNITNCAGNVTNMRSVFHSRHIFNNTIHTRMTQEGAEQSLQIEHGVYVTEYTCTHWAGCLQIIKYK